MTPLAAASPDTVTTIIASALGAGILAYIRDIIKFVRARHARSAPEAIEAKRINDAVEAANNSVVVAVRSNALLEADAVRLRKEIAEINERHDIERSAWRAELDAMQIRHDNARAHWDTERQSLRAELDAMEERWRQALTDLIDFKNRNGLGSP